MWTLAPREWFAQYRTAPALPQPARVTAMAGEPVPALVTRRLPDQITSSSAIPDEDDSRRGWSKVRVLGTLVIHINLVSPCFCSVIRPLIEEFHWKQNVFWKSAIEMLFWRDITQWVSRVSVYSIYSVIRLNQYRKCTLILVWGHFCMGIFNLLNTRLHTAKYLQYITVLHFS